MPDSAEETGLPRRAWGFGLATVVLDRPAAGTVLDTWFPAPELGEPTSDEAPTALRALEGEHPGRRVRTEVVRTAIDLDEPPADTSDAYLRLHLLSHRLVRPRGLNVDAIFRVLPNVVWTSVGPCPVDGFEEIRMTLRAGGPVAVFGVDKFP